MPLTQRPKVVVFDFNGTLFDDLHVAYGSVQEIFKTYGISCPTLVQYREEITANLKFYYQYGIPSYITLDELNAIRRKFYRKNHGNAQIRSDVSVTLNWLLIVGFHTAIVSAEATTTLHRFLIQGGLNRKFDFIRTEAWDGKDKALLQVADILNCPPEDMVYIDDTVDGLTAAKNAGVIPIAFINSTGYNSERRLLEVTDLSMREIGEIENIIPKV